MCTMAGDSLILWLIYSIIKMENGDSWLVGRSYTPKKPSQSKGLKFDQRCLITMELYMESEPRSKSWYFLSTDRHSWPNLTKLYLMVSTSETFWNSASTIKLCFLIMHTNLVKINLLSSLPLLSKCRSWIVAIVTMVKISLDKTEPL